MARGLVSIMHRRWSKEMDMTPLPLFPLVPSHGLIMPTITQKHVTVSMTRLITDTPYDVEGDCV